jgi:hypothetical protein
MTGTSQSRTALWAVLALAVLVATGRGSVSVAQEAPLPTVQERLGYPRDARLLVIHADDFGMSHSVNRATIEALTNKWITSASILVPCPWFPEVVRFARANPDADLGIHMAVNSEWTTYRWGPVSGRSEVPSLLDPDGYLPLVEPTVVAQAKPADVERELRAQVDRARTAGINLTHLDSHMATLFRSPELFDVYRRMGPAYGLPLLLERAGARGGDEAGFQTGAQQDALIDRVLSINPGVSAAEWQKTYEAMLAPLTPGVYQLIVHLAYDDDEMRGATADHPDWGAAWRQQDLELVKSDSFRKFLADQKFVLIGWRELARAATVVR